MQKQGVEENLLNLKNGIKTSFTRKFSKWLKIAKKWRLRKIMKSKKWYKRLDVGVPSQTNGVKNLVSEKFF